MLGADKGGLDEDTSIKIMKDYLSKCEIPIEIWRFDSKAKDDLYDKFKTEFINNSDSALMEKSGLKIDAINKIKKSSGS